MGYRAFASEQEQAQAAQLMAAIDRGEKWIFAGAPGSAEFGGYLQKLYFERSGTWGVFHACLFRDRLRLQIGFRPDLPLGEETGLVELIRQARRLAPGPASIWYPPENVRLEHVIWQGLPWLVRGHKTYELAFDSVVFAPLALPHGLEIVPYNRSWLDAVCQLLDLALAHTFADPAVPVFSRGKADFDAAWPRQAQAGACCLLLEKHALAGFVSRRGAEIDLMAVAPGRQGRGLGRHLLHQACEAILAEQSGEPHLYCLESNARALSFYLREGMHVTGHAGYAWLEARPET